MKMLLKYDGHVVQTVESGEAALTLLERDLFDLVITDYSMGGMTGNQLAGIIKQRWPGQPVIMASAFAGDFHAAGKPFVNVDFILSKPFSRLELGDAIAKVMTHHIVAPASAGSSGLLPAMRDLPPSTIQP